MTPQRDTIVTVKGITGGVTRGMGKRGMRVALSAVFPFRISPAN